MIGEVVEFDEDGGYGTVQSDAGEPYFFHCTAVVDGSRTIDVGVKVRFDVIAGRRGLWEGADLTPMAAP